MTKEDLFKHLATGSVKVKSTVKIEGSDTSIGSVQDITFLGSKIINVSVLFEGNKWETRYNNSYETVTHRVRPLSELVAHVPEPNIPAPYNKIWDLSKDPRD